MNGPTIALHGIYFDTDKAYLKSESAPTLKEIAGLLATDPKLSVLVVGHTDSQGSFDYNIDLSSRRAVASRPTEGGQPTKPTGRTDLTGAPARRITFSMRANYHLQRLFVPHDLGAGVAFDASRQQGHYLAHVLRMEEGAELLVFNGRDGEWSARIAAVTKKTVRLAVDAQTRPQPPAPGLVYAFAPLKVGRLDYLVQKAVEMGAGLLQPVITQHTQVAKPPMEKIEANAIEAAEQCGVLALPALRPPLKLEPFLAGWEKDRRLIFCDEDSGNDNPLSVLKAIAEEKVGLLVGPEGGFSRQERAMLRALPFVTSIGLGPRILRADTAAVAALALVQSTLGDWR